MEHILYWLWLTDAISFSKIKRLHKYFGNAEKIYEQSDYTDFPYLKAEDTLKLKDKSLDNAKLRYNLCLQKGIRIIVWDSHDYPPLLRHISEPPLILYARGIIPDWRSIFTVGIVGTRSMTNYGREVTEKFASGLINEGVTIVTGFAYGNDISATRLAVERGVFSIALLGGGVDVIYPRIHEQLYNKMVSCGLFLSEQPPGTPPYGYNFPKRNRILSGICRAVLITEAPEVSGAIITAHMASDQGRDVFVVPGAINASSSKGANMLIQEGAYPVLDSRDIIGKYPVFEERRKRKAEIQASPPEADKPPQPVTDAEGAILSALEKRDMNTDDLSSETGMPMTECNSCCLMLEISGKIMRLPGNVYHKK
ncbi:MAG: DNA-processing protein DprA [Clostridia bacterium]|nr:DNA-processing protein DprA [Clostridia bacterium]